MTSSPGAIDRLSSTLHDLPRLTLRPSERSFEPTPEAVAREPRLWVQTLLVIAIITFSIGLVFLVFECVVVIVNKMTFKPKPRRLRRESRGPSSIVGPGGPISATSTPISSPPVSPTLGAVSPLPLPPIVTSSSYGPKKSLDMGRMDDHHTYGYQTKGRRLRVLFGAITSGLGLATLIVMAIYLSSAHEGMLNMERGFHQIEVYEARLRGGALLTYGFVARAHRLFKDYLESHSSGPLKLSGIGVQVNSYLGQAEDEAVEVVNRSGIVGRNIQDSIQYFRSGRQIWLAVNITLVILATIIFVAWIISSAISKYHIGGWKLLQVATICMAILLWLSGSLQFGLSVGIGDLCTNPAAYLEEAIMKYQGSIDRSIIRYYIHCPPAAASQSSTETFVPVDEVDFSTIPAGTSNKDYNNNDNNDMSHNSPRVANEHARNMVQTIIDADMKGSKPEETMASFMVGDERIDIPRLAFIGNDSLSLDKLTHELRVAGFPFTNDHINGQYGHHYGTQANGIMIPSDDPSYSMSSTGVGTADDIHRYINESKRTGGLTGIEIPKDYPPASSRVHVANDNPLRRYVKMALVALNFTAENMPKVRPHIVSELGRMNSSDAQYLIGSMESAIAGAMEMTSALDSILDCRPLHYAFQTISKSMCYSVFEPMFTIAFLSGVAALWMWITHLLIPRMKRIPGTPTPRSTLVTHTWNENEQRRHGAGGGGGDNTPPVGAVIPISEDIARKGVRTSSPTPSIIHPSPEVSGEGPGIGAVSGDDHSGDGEGKGPLRFEGPHGIIYHDEASPSPSYVTRPSAPSVGISLPPSPAAPSLPSQPSSIPPSPETEEAWRSHSGGVRHFPPPPLSIEDIKTHNNNDDNDDNRLPSRAPWPRAYPRLPTGGPSI